MKKTKNYKQNTGIGDYQIDKAYGAKWLILETLSDGQWHRNMELKDKTKLSSRTLTKYLSQWTSLQIIEKKTDVESGKYPIPVLYKAEPELTAFMKASKVRREVLNSIEPILDETKDPLMVLEIIHEFSQLYFLELLKRIQRNKNITDTEIYFYSEIFLWANYKQFTSKLIKASYKMIGNINIIKSLINQAKRRIRTSPKMLESYQKYIENPENLNDTSNLTRATSINIPKPQTYPLRRRLRIVTQKAENTKKARRRKTKLRGKSRPYHTRSTTTHLVTSLATNTTQTTEKRIYQT